MNYEIPETMKAWVLGDPGVLTLEEKPVPQPKKSEVLVKIDAVAICATDLEIIENGPPAMIQAVCLLIRVLRPVMSIWEPLLSWEMVLMSIKLATEWQWKSMPAVPAVSAAARACIHRA